MIYVVDISPNATLIGKPVMRDGIKYMELEDFPVLIGPARLVKLNFGNLFGGNKQLGEFATLFIVFKYEYRRTWYQLSFGVR